MEFHFRKLEIMWIPHFYRSRGPRRDYWRTLPFAFLWAFLENWNGRRFPFRKEWDSWKYGVAMPKLNATWASITHATKDMPQTMAERKIGTKKHRWIVKSFISEHFGYRNGNVANPIHCSCFRFVLFSCVCNPFAFASAIRSPTLDVIHKSTWSKTFYIWCMQLLGSLLVVGVWRTWRSWEMTRTNCFILYETNISGWGMERQWL